jgi:tRNA dimethylallyltransferase
MSVDSQGLAPCRPLPESIPLVVVVGPTATGKTALALEIARRWDAEVVGADAYQVYRAMDIGTAKPTADELGDIRHHLLDVVDVDEHFDAHRYCQLVHEAIAEIHHRGKRVVVAGGTGLYVRALVRGLAAMPGADEELRAEFMEVARVQGPQALFEQLEAVDPDYAQRVGPTDEVRIVRALEVYRLTGRTITAVHAEHQQQPPRYPSLWLGLDPGRETLRSRIEVRANQMFNSGFIDEVRRLLEAGYSPDLPALKALGYPSVVQMLAGEIDEEEARRLTIRDTARFAKRQRNWFRSEPDVLWAASLQEAEPLMARVGAYWTTG